ncbi:hypothetical protein PENANT_c028G09936 [Penicillium antarcticum]|uniref:BZIP domain-containing protein n=1 Tax=Penicillium antarcticum TaxID=416450 RepID=A0A1V6PXZ6_9EURO|nr:uncharacterized protein N7508_008995 [Penicillium antarcticum]KAJ5294174.1 hypothetical protein N7508_008995 [Penicillium antarcticum]OQD81336.1 hypothetical protein PENANT_c028G09936 [Penicillium antarcticum]
MSKDRRRAGSLTRDALQADDRAISNEHGPAGNRVPARRPPLRTRPQSWHPYGPVEPPLESPSSRPIGVHAILNPPSQTATEMPSSKREPFSLPGPSSSPRPQGSSPTARPGPPLAPHPLSPRSHSRALMNPGSPSARFVGGGGRTSGQSSVAQSPLVPQEPFMGPRPPAASSPHPTETGLRSIASITGTQPPVSAALHSTPSLHSRRTSAGPGPLTNPNSQETSPITPHSTFSQFGRASPAVTSVSIPHSAPAYSAASPYMTMEPHSRGVPAPAGPRIKAEETPSRAGTPQSGAFPPGMIPCVLDMRSGSSSQAEKRKANSDASRRFRNRKRNEMQLEQRLTAQQEEIQRSMETVRRQSDEIRSLIQQRDHYHSERDFYRDQLSRTIPQASLPPRPPSPRSSQPALVPNADPAGPTTWSGADSGRSVSGTQPAQAGPPPRMLEPVQVQGQAYSSSYPSTPVPPTARGVPPAPSASVSGGLLPPIQGTWPRT